MDDQIALPQIRNEDVTIGNASNYQARRLILARTSSGYHHNWICYATDQPDPAYEKEEDATSDARTRDHEVVFCGPCSKELSLEKFDKRTGAEVWHVAPK